MSPSSPSLHVLSLALLALVASGMLVNRTVAGEVPQQAMVELDEALEATREASSGARQRLAIRRVIRDAEKLVEAHKDDPSRFSVLEFIFRARQQLVALDKDPKHRQELLETCRELVKAPDAYAEQRVEADLLLSQVELAKQGADAEARARALRPFVERYLDTPAGNKVLRMALVMALELGDERLVVDLQQLIRRHFPADLEMIRFQRDRLAGDVFGAPICGAFKRSDDKIVRLPMDLLGRSTFLVFWSKEGEGMDYIKSLAADALAMKEQLGKRLEIISFNLDDLPDAGESIVRGLGVDWQVLHLPGGRKNPIYDAYVRTDPLRVIVSPTGQAALVMEGTGRIRRKSDGTLDHQRMLESAVSKNWSFDTYAMQLSAMFVGDFLVFDPEAGASGGIDPTLPPELKAAAGNGEAKPLVRDASGVPGEALRAIQSAFIAPPLRYRISHDEARESYRKVVRLCRMAIADHPRAPDLWIVRNRLIVALMGLWRNEADLSQLEAAFAEARAATAAGYPAGCDAIARFCLTREALRDPAADPRAVIDGFVAERGGDKAPGTVRAMAALLSLDVGDRKGFENHRDAILKDHTEPPMMWVFSAFLLNRYHQYYLFQVPFGPGRTYPRREDYFLTRGGPEAACRRVEWEFQTLDGKTVRYPGALDAKWTAIALARPWGAGEGPSPEGDLKSLLDLAAKRPEGEVKVALLVFSDDADKVRALLGEKFPAVDVLLVPGGMDSALVHRLGMTSENQSINRVLLRRDGTIVAVASGLTAGSRSGGPNFENIMCWHDEKEVIAAIGKGDLEKARRIAFSLAPVFDPEATDEKGRKLKRPRHNAHHLLARARVCMAMEQWDKALADAREIVDRSLAISGSLSMRIEELDEAEALRDFILGKMPASE